MKINRFYNVQSISRPTDVRATSRKKEAGRTFGDFYQPSAEMNEFIVARRAVSAAPDVREERIADIQAQMQAGSYFVSAQDIASKMLDATI